MFSNSSKVWNWLVVSSEDPTQVAATIKGVVTMILPLLAFAVHGPDFSNLPMEAYTVVMDLFAVVGAALTLAGFVRKVWNTFTQPNPPTTPPAATS